MKFLVLTLILSVSSFAAVVDMQCEITRPVVIQTTWGARAFKQAVIKINSITKENFNASGYIEDRFGPNMEFFNRLWSQTRRCSQGEVCFGTDFSSIRGLGFRVPAEAFERSSYRFTMNIRNNRSNRSMFANCYTRSY